MTVFFSSFLLASYSNADNSIGTQLDKLLKEYNGFFKKGDFVNAEMTAMLYLGQALNDYQKGSGYSMLAAVYTSLERYDDAMNWLTKTEKLSLAKDEQDYILGYSYVVQAVISEKKRSYFKAIEFNEKAVRIYESAVSRNKYFLEALSAAYHNLGTYYVEIGQYKKALQFLEKSMKMSETYGFHNKGITHISMAKAYQGLKEYDLAESNFRNCIKTSIKDFGHDYYGLPALYFDYGEFLQNSGRISEASNYFRTGLAGCLKIFGEKNNRTSYGFNLMGKNQLLRGNADSSLYYYQRSLISIVDDFNESDITKNPGIVSSILDVRLMENLKGKSEALEYLASKEKGDARVKTLMFSLQTIDLAMDLIDVIRNNYPSEETMLHLAGNEKQTFITALRIASGINSDSGGNKFTERMYDIVLRAKAAILRNQISGNNVFYSTSLPDTIRENILSLSGNISGYNKLILEESNKAIPDTIALNMWKDELFEMNLEKKKLTDSLVKYVPGYTSLLNKSLPVPLSEIQSKIEKDEIVIDYFISKTYNEGKRKLYIFLVSRNNLNCIEEDVDSLFEKNAGILNFGSDPLLRQENINSYLSSLHYFYLKLIGPAENLIKGRRLIIVPDEEINRLPFEAFLRDEPERGRNDFDGLHFLIEEYTISHSYSASLLPGPEPSGKRMQVFSFSPSYGEGSGLDSLGGAVREIRNINSIVGGRSHIFDSATKANFLKVVKDSVIFHLAMHSISDSLNSLYSYLLFSTGKSDDESSRLYSYEVSLSNINSPMIVLSSCNSGTGDLYSGEGQLSLARSFMLAGASSVVKTSWDVNDDSGSEIITRFYFWLSKGMKKDEALRRAKLDFLRKSPPALRDPYYWAAYEILGENGPVTRYKSSIVTFVTIPAIIIVGMILYYFRRRRIFAERSR